MFHYFIYVASDKTHKETILTELDNICDDSTKDSDMVVACKDLRQWLTKVGNSAKPLYKDFESLVESHPFHELCPFSVSKHTSRNGSNFLKKLRWTCLEGGQECCN
ncbi:hypothetical protein S245_070298 [Arachis hypogaea]|nr:uncharacterized protein DS421_20g691950 [Arachis hypogaea]